MTHGFRVRGAIALAVGAAVVAAGAAPAEASSQHQYVTRARAHATSTVVEMVRVTVSATAQAVAGTPPTKARATVRVLVVAKGRATRSAWAVARGSGPTPRAARRAARAAAENEARHEAETKARALARARALVQARLRGVIRARRAAARAARQKARTLAAQRGVQQAAGVSGCLPLARADDANWTCVLDDEDDAVLSAGSRTPTYGAFSASSGRFAVRAAESGEGVVLELAPTTDGTAEPANRIEFPMQQPGSFHEYAVEWTPTTVTTLVDGQPVSAASRAADGTSPFDRSFSVVLSAAGADPAEPTASAADLQIDWVRAWQQ